MMRCGRSERAPQIPMLLQLLLRQLTPPIPGSRNRSWLVDAVCCGRDLSAAETGVDAADGQSGDSTGDVIAD